MKICRKANTSEHMKNHRNFDEPFLTIIVRFVKHDADLVGKREVYIFFDYLYVITFSNGHFRNRLLQISYRSPINQSL
uniref:Uncharacterized protein n=1 Tax=Anopheles minimus TaxID=112268 RepID=A0A182W919_9DIPT